jgi:organic hydroperoxide reductase OsmC/OhrA
MVAGRRQQLSVEQVSITARVGIGPVSGERRFGLEAELRVRLPGLTRAEAEALVAAADEGCPYSNAIRGNVPVTLLIEEPPASS